MPAPRPLTLCPSAKLDWARPEIPVAADFGDVYFSTDGGLDEARTVFLQGCGLPEGWQNTERFVIGELGFGSGLNFLAAWRMWDQTKPENGHLHFVSIEKHPFDGAQLEDALSAWPELDSYAQSLISQWPGRVRGFHRLHFSDVTLTLVHDDVVDAIPEIDMRANAWFLDGFSPSKNPAMWSADIMKALAARSAPGARLATFTVASKVRNALQDAGFIVERKAGFGRKRHRLEARLDGEPATYSYPIQTPVIIGAGIGGLSLANAFLRRGITPTLIEDKAHIAASGNAAALVKPRLDLQDRPESRFFLGSYFYALQSYQDAVLSIGISHIPKNTSDEKRHAKLLDQGPLPKTHLTSEDNKTLLFPNAITIEPLSYRQIILAKVTYENQIIDNLKDGPAILFIAAGFGIQNLIPNWPLRFSRGQVSWAKSFEGLDKAVSYGGYAIPQSNTVLIGATHDRLVDGKNPFQLIPSDDEKNLEQFNSYMKNTATLAEKPSRASVRVTSADTLPVIGQTPDGHFVLTGLGSRGFVFAPLLAEAIVSHYFGDPMPIAKSVWQRFSVARLLD